MRDTAPWQDDLREAERDARAVVVFYDRPEDGPTTRAEVSQEQGYDEPEWRKR